MSSPILPISDSPRPSAAGPPGETGDVAAFMSELTAGERALAIEASRGGPPPEVLESMAAAGRIHEELRQSGYELAFTGPIHGRPVEVELRDGAGRTVRKPSLAEALEIVAGKPVE